MIKKHIIKALLPVFALCAALSSCSESDMDLPDMPGSGSISPDGVENNFSLNITVTLDNMGGTRAAGDYNPMEEIENYIDPEKFRVLFFDHEDKFLFESKSRWVQRLGSSASHTEWLVSVPFYDSGNDADYNWDWDLVRTALTTHTFKVAILANRPEWECFPDLDKNFGRIPKFDNSGPNWDKSDVGIRTLFDLHHCQWDPIYTSKSIRNNGTVEGYYDFIMGTLPGVTNYADKLSMSAVSTWVDHGPNLDDNGTKYTYLNSNGKSNSRRRFIRPSKSYPIPMYGLQQFDKIEHWVKGTPFNLSSITEGSDHAYNYKSISLLRSVVKLELRIPKEFGSKPGYVALRYPNVHARCEPMVNWVPTDQIWQEDHDNGCEWKTIHAYGSLARNGDYTGGKDSETDVNNDNSWREFRNRIAWFYKAWVDSGKWTFPSDVTPQSSAKPPMVFNPVTQRNESVICDNLTDFTDAFNDGYYHYIVYTGERNVTDPSVLYNIGNNQESGKNTLIYWAFNIGTNLYSVPFVDYQNSAGFNPAVVETGAYVSGQELSNNMGDYEKSIMSDPLNTAKLPYPLVRNHVYTITIGRTGTKPPSAPLRKGTIMNADFPITSENRASASIRFK